MRYVPFVTLGCASIFSLTVFWFTSVGLAQVMQSNNYAIQSDSVNTGGGLSTSSNYILESTAGEVATGISSSTSYSLKAGYQQMQEVYLSLSGAGTVDLAPNISGISGGVANGSTTIKVTTDSPSGYSLSIQSSIAPAMQSLTDTLADYSTTTTPDFDFVTSASDAHFGFSPFGTDIVDRYKNNGSACNLGSNITSGKCWSGLSLTPTIMAQSFNSNHPTGTDTVINFQVGIGSSANIASGIYIATTTITALPL